MKIKDSCITFNDPKSTSITVIGQNVNHPKEARPLPLNALNIRSQSKSKVSFPIDLEHLIAINFPVNRRMFPSSFDILALIQYKYFSDTTNKHLLMLAQCYILGIVFHNLQFYSRSRDVRICVHIVIQSKWSSSVEASTSDKSLVYVSSDFTYSECWNRNLG